MKNKNLEILYKLHSNHCKNFSCMQLNIHIIYIQINSTVFKYTCRNIVTDNNTKNTNQSYTI